MTKLLFTLAISAANLAAELPFRTAIPSNSNVRAAVGPNGDIWIAGIDRIARLDIAGRTVFATTIEAQFGITALAVDANGRAAVTTFDTLVLLDPQGRIVRAQKLDVFPSAVAIDAGGNIFLAGVARNGFIGPPGVYKPSFGEKNCTDRNGDYYFCDDAFLAKYLPDGTRAWVTLFGGSSKDYASAIALDPSGSIWIAGETTSPNMPVTANALQSVYGGGEYLGPLTYGDGFIARIDATGSRLEYATFLGGSRLDRTTALTISAAGVVVTGVTESPNFTTTPDAYRRLLASSKVEMPGMQADVFVAFVSAQGALVYSTLYGDEGPDTAIASSAGLGNAVGVVVTGKPGQCMLRLEVRESISKFTPDCLRGEYARASALLFARGEWLGVGTTKGGFPIPAVTQTGYATVFKFGDAPSGSAVVGVWNEHNSRYRPIVAADSFISIYATNLTSARVQLGGRELKVIYSSNNQINAYVAADTPKGTLDLTINGRDPTPVDVVERWPGLASAALNQDGTINSAAHPAERGTIVSLFGTGFGPDPLPVIEPFIEAPAATNSQGMELLFAGRIADGLFQLNARIAQNARAGHTAVRVVFRTPSGLLSSDLARIYVR